MDVSGLDALAYDLEHAARASDDAVAKVVKRGAVNIKKDARERATGHLMAPRLAYSIGFDLERDGLEAVIGPDKNVGVGPLGTFYEYGSASAAPQPFLAPAIDAEAPRFEKALLDEAVKAVLW